MRGADDTIDRLRLVRTDRVGPVTYRQLLARFGSAAAALDALPRLARAGGKAGSPLVSPSRADVEREIEQTTQIGGHLIFSDDPDYPPMLAMLDDAPPCLAVLGDTRLLSQRAVALVGGRNASTNGQRMADTLAADLARDVVVVSGLARGVDTAAHQGALRSGTTIAVIAGGLDIVYPPENEALQAEIALRGAVVTESPIGASPQARHFPRRNRIIAGLSLAVVVVEAALHSGSLITARLAQDIGREVFAVPGSPLDPRARGGNELIKQGAMLVETVADVLDNLPMDDAPPLFRTSVAEPPTPWIHPADLTGPPDSVRAEVLGLLSSSPTKVDDLVRRCQFSSSAVMAVLLELELAGRVETLPGSRVALLSDAAS